MSKETNNSVMGRPVTKIKLPRRGRPFTVTQLHQLNKKTVKCRLTIYTRVGELVASKVLRYTGDTTTSGGRHGVGKPLQMLERV